ncbi:RlpA-like double-psi beta-barrel-protein domain-containing protein-containing protein, partial [Flammula alnicola]
LGACGTRNVNSDHVVALPTLEFAGGTRCNRMVRVYYKEKSVDAKVVDLCPSCSMSGIDLSLSAFQALAPPEVGLIQIYWQYI